MADNRLSEKFDALSDKAKESANKVAATRIEMPGHAGTRMPRITARSSEASVHFHRSGNSLGGWE